MITNYPNSIDQDQTLPRVSDNITELGEDAINALRDAVFSIEKTLGINPQGSVSDAATRLNVSLNSDGTIKASALTSVGLITLPIVNNEVAANAGILESKLALSFTTQNLHDLISANTTLINSVAAFITATNTNFLSHTVGVFNRLKASYVDLDMQLLDRTGAQRSATDVFNSLFQINTDLTTHENSTDATAHFASGISVDSSKFVSIGPVRDVQEALAAIDNVEGNVFTPHRATMHANGILRTDRSNSFNLDGYSTPVVPITTIHANLLHGGSSSPVDDVNFGDDVINFIPPSTNSTDHVFDSQFAQVKIGDVLTVQYGNGIQITYPVESINYTPGSTYNVRINGINVADADGYAQINRSLVDTNTFGKLAVASANNTLGGTYASIPSSVIVVDPKNASVLGIGFDASKIDINHYNLYLQLYPTGNPADQIISLLPIDVSGDAGASVGSYTLEGIINSTNNAFRAAGYNYRFCAFSLNGEFGIAMTDCINGASFSIVNGTISAGSLVPGLFINNVIGDSTDFVDALGFGVNGSNVASPPYSTSFSAIPDSNLATKIFAPKKNRDFVVNGILKDGFKLPLNSIADGYYPALISARNVVSGNVEVSYTIPIDLCDIGLAPGKTITIQPSLLIGSPGYNVVDYGRFIIKDVSFLACGVGSPSTTITVINGLHNFGGSLGYSSPANTPVKLYFDNSSVGFDANQITNSNTDLNRYFEVYSDDNGHTFAHERASFPQQAGGGFLLRTTESSSTQYLNITNVSPKLRGFRDTGSTSSNKFVRLWITKYNATSGEFDGYIGRRNPLNSQITNFGETTHCYKNTRSRLYDETNIDFIELEFIDNSTTGTVIPQGYVDISIYSSLALDDEFINLANFEAHKNVITNVYSVNKFGTTSELDFTQSAIDFIHSGDRALHENGIIRGFDFVNITPDVSGDSKVISYAGGKAFVNGAIVDVNALSITIPRVFAGSPSLTWIICVEETGQLTCLPLTTTKSQVFLNGNKFIQSTTFPELIHQRKDLTPISIAVATQTPFGIVVSDARKIINKGAINQQLVWAGNELIGNFGETSIVALRNWINNYGSVSNKIVVRGTFNISSQLDFSGFSNPVVFEGENCVFNVSSPNGIILGSNIIMRGINFNYNPVGMSYRPNDNVYRLNGCLFTSGAKITNVNIENCVFNSTNAQRPPMISMTLNNGEVLENISIKNNKFNDTISLFGAAIAITSSNIEGSSLPTFGGIVAPAVVSNCNIEGNITNSNQGIYITSVSAALPGIRMIGGNINNNIVGFIATIISGAKASPTTNVSENIYLVEGLSIHANTCRFINNLDAQGIVPLNITLPTGMLIVDGNYCNWIGEYNNNTQATGNNQAALIIKNNFIRAYDPIYSAAVNFGAAQASMFSTAIYVQSTPFDSLCTSIITDNQISQMDDPSNALYTYDKGIYCGGSSIISGNIVKGFSTIGIDALTGAGNISVHRNQIYRYGQIINHYIQCQAGMGIVSENIFDSDNVDGAVNYSVINNISSGVICQYNKNNRITKQIFGNTFNMTGGGTLSSGPSDGVFCVNGFVGPKYDASLNVVAGSDSSVLYTINIDAVAGSVVYGIPLASILPKNITLINLTFDWNASAHFSGGMGIPNKLEVNIVSNGVDMITPHGYSSYADLTTGTVATDYTLGLNFSGNPPIFISDATNPVVNISFNANSSGAATLDIKNLIITYKY